jgi:hypothetical protein
MFPWHGKNYLTGPKLLHACMRERLNFNHTHKTARAFAIGDASVVLG